MAQVARTETRSKEGSSKRARINRLPEAYTYDGIGTTCRKLWFIRFTPGTWQASCLGGHQPIEETMPNTAITARNKKIVREWLKGEPMGRLATRYKITRQRVWQIIRAQGGDVKERRYIQRTNRG